jgi:streptogramin lyase
MKYLALIIAFLISPLFKVIAADKKPALVPAGIKGRLLLRMPATKTTDNPEDPSKPSSKKGIHVITVGGRPERWGKVNGGRGTSQFFDPHTIWIGADGHAYISEHWNHGVRRITAGNYIASEVAGNLLHATGLGIDPVGNLYVTRFYSGDIVRITPDGQGKVVQSGFTKPCGVCVDSNGTMWVANTYASQIIRINPVGDRAIWNGMRAHHIALGPNGDLYVACQADQTIRRIGEKDSPEEAVEIVAGKPDQTGHIDGPVEKARFTDISGVTVSPSGAIYVGDNSTIRRISPGGQVSTLAGDPMAWRILEKPADKESFGAIAGLAIDAKGNLWMAIRDKTVRLVLNAERGLQK